MLGFELMASAWLLAVVGIAVWAYQWGYHPFVWGFTALLLTPVLAALILWNWGPRPYEEAGHD